MQKLRQHAGFAIIEMVLGTLLVIAIAAAGYFAYHAHIVAGKTGSIAKDSPAPAQSPLIYQDSDGSIYQIDLEAQTPDQKGMAAVLDAACQPQTATPSGDHTYVAITGIANLFTTKTNSYTLDGTFAAVDQGCYDKTTGGPQFGGGAVAYLRKLNGTWTFVTEGQEESDCSDWDGTGVPSDIVSSCYDTVTNSSRSPKP